MNRFYRLVIPKSFSSDQREAAELQIKFALISMVAMMINAYFFTKFSLHQSALYVGFNSILVGCTIPLLRISRSVTLTMYALVVPTTVVIGMIATELGGVGSPYVFWLAMIPIVASMVTGRKHGVTVAILCALVATFITGKSMISLPESPFSIYVDYIMSLFTLIGIMGLATIFTFKFQEMKDVAYEELDRRNSAIERVVNNVRSGFLICDSEFKIQEGYSESCRKLLDIEEPLGLQLPDLLEKEEGSRNHLSLCWGQVFEDIFPEEVAFSQAPHRFCVGNDRHISVEGKAIRDPETKDVVAILFSISDITTLIASEKENEDNKHTLQILKNKEGFTDMLRESREFLETLEKDHLGPKNPLAMRILHTMKGNTSSFGMIDLAAKIHEIESKDELSKQDLEVINDAFDKFLDDHKEVLGISNLRNVRAARYAVSEEALGRLAGILDKNVDASHPAHRAISQWLEEVQTLDIRRFLVPMEGQLVRISESIGKPALLKISGDHTKIGKHFSKFCQHLPNLFRNSLYHGIEEQHERGDKPWPPTLEIRITDKSHMVRVELIDDGRGIDPQRIKKKVKENGVYSEEKLEKLSDHQLVQLIFEDGVSTEESVNEIAGRGAGTSAVKADIESMGGAIEVISEPGKGTTFQVDLPKNLVEDARSKAA